MFWGPRGAAGLEGWSMAENEPKQAGEYSEPNAKDLPSFLPKPTTTNLEKELEFSKLARQIYDEAHEKVLALHRRIFGGKTGVPVLCGNRHIQRVCRKPKGHNGFHAALVEWEE